MVFRYPVRNFRCPFCGTKMRTEEYKGFEPWVCHGCSAELQFSAAHGSILQFCFIGVALLLLYFAGLRDWWLAITVIPTGFILTFIFTVPLDRILPRRLEPYCPPPWKKDRFVENGILTLFPHEQVESDKSKEADQSDDDVPKDS